ncbi:MAG: SAM-dependent methyltransferase [Hyphomicrobiales bacterium]|nr:SAM-dependent methyltransferase [Hyphomicrobiales bacterium]MDE2115206.1 class I SAM-dependent methyltransferase [Hyphomicrobiales bacterium]
MSGFSPEWLALRENADRAACNERVRHACAQHFSGREALRIVDLGCGDGSNFRLLQPYLGRQQFWLLIDHDPRLLDAARQRLTQWADAAELSEGRLHLRRENCALTIEFAQADLAVGVAPWLEGADLVTAKALFDLCSKDWIAQFARELAARAIPLMASLSYDGREAWQPPHPADVAMLTAFHAHQQRDKGLGPAAGPQAATCLRECLAQAGYKMVHGASDWQITGDDAKLMAALAQGSAQAVSETGLVAPDVIAAWASARIGALAVRIGHEDLFAHPPGRR